MNIKHPEFLFLLALIPAGIMFFYWVYAKRNQVLRHLGDWKRVREQFPTSTKNRILTRYFLLLLALSMIVIGLISPRWGYDWQEVETKGANVYIAIDVSKSMLADDISPNRLTRAKFEMAKMLDIMSGDRVGLIVFAGDAFLQTPLTHDYTMVQEWLSRIDVSSVPVPGTSIRSAVDMAIKGFEHIESEAKILILISDGEEYDKATMDSVMRARGQGIKIYAIGVGTEAGSPVHDDQTGALIVDKQGNVVISKLDDSFLREIAKAAGGVYLRSTTGDFQTKSLYFDHIRKEIPAELLKSGKSKRWYETYQIFISIAVIALVLELLLTVDLALISWLQLKFLEWKRSRRKSPKFYTWLILLLLSGVQPASANIFDPNLWFGDHALSSSDYVRARDHYLKAQISDTKNPRLSYNLGICSYRQAFGRDGGTEVTTPELMQEAAQLFSVAASNSKSPKLTAKALYNLGNALAYSGKLKDAITAYEKALIANPKDEDAKYNLDKTKAKQKELEEKCPPDKNNQNQQNQQQQQQKQNQEQKQEEQKQQEQRQDMDRLMQGVNDSPPPKMQAAKPKPPPDPEHWW